MHFRLTYRGPLRPNGGPAEKQRLRCLFQAQFVRLWAQLPLSRARANSTMLRPGGDMCILAQVGAFTFAPLVHSKMSLVADLDILFLRPSEPGSLVDGG